MRRSNKLEGLLESVSLLELEGLINLEGLIVYATPSPAYPVIFTFNESRLSTAAGIKDAFKEGFRMLSRSAAAPRRPQGGNS